MDINEEVYRKLNQNQKQIIEMYLTARQFNNAVLEQEMIIIPSSSMGVVDGTVINWGGHKVTCRGDKSIVRIYPHIVTKAFACEVYLKLVLALQKEINLRKYGHNIFSLYKGTTEEFKLEFIETLTSNYGEKFNKEFIETELKNISNVFEEWRYIYEKTGVEKNVNIGFLNVLCKYLDRYSHRKIFEEFGYDVDRNMR